MCFQVLRPLLSMELWLFDFNNLKVRVLVVIIVEILRHDGVSFDLVSFDLLSFFNVLLFVPVLKEIPGQEWLPHNGLLLYGAL